MPSEGELSEGVVASTTEPLPVVVAETGWLLLFEPMTVAEAGNAVPFILAVVVAHEAADVVVSPVKAGSAAHGKPVAFVNVTEEGVPSAGVASVGLVDKTTLPVPVELVQTGAAETEPLPVWVKTANVDDVLPAKRAAAGVEFSYMISPSVVMGLESAPRVCPLKSSTE